MVCKSWPENLNLGDAANWLAVQGDGIDVWLIVEMYQLSFLDIDLIGDSSLTILPLGSKLIADYGSIDVPSHLSR